MFRVLQSKKWLYFIDYKSCNYSPITILYSIKNNTKVNSQNHYLLCYKCKYYKYTPVCGLKM